MNTVAQASSTATVTWSEGQPVAAYMTAVGQAARAAATLMAAASTAAKNGALLALARQIRAHAGELKARNASERIIVCSLFLPIKIIWNKAGN